MLDVLHTLNCMLQSIWQRNPYIQAGPGTAGCNAGSAQVFNELDGNTWSSLAKLRACVGDVNADVDNEIMEAEMKRQRGNSDTGEVSHLYPLRL